MALGDYNRSIEAYVKATEVSPTDSELMKEFKLCKMVYWPLFKFIGKRIRNKT